MKKFLIFIALISACIPAIQGLPTEVEEKYDIIKNRHKLEQLKRCVQMLMHLDLSEFYRFAG